MKKADLIRKVDKRHIRFYRIYLFKSLFGEYMVEIVFGSIFNKYPTGRVKKYFQSQKEALDFFTQKIKSKVKRGYRQAPSGQEAPNSP